jgi:hypothetical protein
MTTYSIGDKVTNPAAFTSPIGTHFPAGTVFTVHIGGETAGRSIQLIADQCGSVAWITDGSFLIAERDDLEELARRDARTRAALPCNCDIPGMIQCDLHGPRE